MFIVSSYQLYQILNALLRSYRFENDRIIRGRIMDADRAGRSSMSSEIMEISRALKNIDSSDSVMYDNTAENFNKIFSPIKLNMKYRFANACFDTAVYKKKEFLNPGLVKETRHSLIYSCDNKRRLVIPKIYEGISENNTSKESSFIKRILVYSLLVFMAALLIAVSDLAIMKYKNTYVYNANISNTIEEMNIGEKLVDCGFTEARSNIASYGFVKKVGEKESVVSYRFDKNGNIDEIDIQLYYNSSSQNVEEELRTIIDSFDDEFDKNDVDKFINLVLKNIAGEFKYGKLISDKYTLRIDRSSGYVDVH